MIDALFEARPPFDPDIITKQAAQLLLQWGVTDATGDAYAAAWPITAFARRGIRFHTAALTTSELYLHTLPLWTAGRVSMLDVPRAVDQLCSLRRKLGQAGKETISHPRTAHDDLACVIAGLLWRLTPVETRKPPIVSPAFYSRQMGWIGSGAANTAGKSATQLFYENGGAAALVARSRKARRTAAAVVCAVTTVPCRYSPGSWRLQAYRRAL